jgi:hypothetical protein
MVMAIEGTFACTFDVTDRLQEGIRIVGRPSYPFTDGRPRLLGYAPGYVMRECPIELTVAGETRIFTRGRATLGPCEIFMRHGSLLGVPGTDECVSIERKGACPETAANTSAQLLETEGLRMER